MTADIPRAASEVFTREEFLRVFEDLASEFKAHKCEVSFHERKFFQAMDRCRVAAQRQPLSESRLEQDHALRGLVQQQVDLIREIFDHWKQKIDNRDTQARFKERLEDSLLVFVYGKVKAGKSSLGNYVAWGDPDPKVHEHAVGAFSGDPEFFKEKDTNRTEETSGDSICEERRFKVGRTETTSAIQGFTLPGLTWVDSPGLHSKTKENGALAHQYVDAADMVLYLTSSTAPCKRSDLVELEDLGGKEHNLAVIITGSDMVEEDEDEHGELVKIRTMKSPVDREEQIGYARRSIAEQVHADGADSSRIAAQTLQRAEVFSISVAYAHEHPDAAGTMLSGVGDMFRCLADLARHEGVRAKQIQPLRNLRAFLLDIHEHDLVDLNRRLEQCRNASEDVRRRARTESEAICKRQIEAIGHEVDELLRKHARKDAEFRIAVGKAQRRWFADLVRNSTEAYKASMEFALPEALDSIAQQIPGLEQRRRAIKRKRTLRSKQGQVIGSLLFSLGAAAFTGGTALAAGAVLATVGGWVGGRIGTLFQDEESVTTPSGDNAQEVGVATKKLLVESLQSRARLAIDALDHACFDALLDWMDNLQRHAVRFKVETIELLAHIDEQIATHHAGGTNTWSANDHAKEAL